VDQSVKAMLEPGQKHEHVEFWIPTRCRLEIRTIGLPAPRLRPVEKVPVFSWARKEEVDLWLELADARKAGDALRIPLAPDLDSNRWAPSGIAELGMHWRGRRAAREMASETDGCFSRARGWRGAARPNLHLTFCQSLAMTARVLWPEDFGSFTGTMRTRLPMRSARSSRRRFLFIRKWSFDLAEFGAYREHRETAFDSGETLPEDRIDSTE
jgi:hypothetical protein